MMERPVLFSAPMVRALLAGTKTQTRRALRVQPPARTYQVSTWHHPSQRPHFYAWEQPSGLESVQIADGWCYPCLYGQPGDRLWVREAWAQDDEDGAIMYRADVGRGGDADAWEQGRIEGVPRYRWRPSIHMPRAASRITLEVTGVRVERLQDVSAADCISEGIGFEVRYGGHCLPDGSYFHCDDPRESYWALWEAINGPGSVEANPWVWAVAFRRVAEPLNVRIEPQP